MKPIKRRSTKKFQFIGSSVTLVGASVTLVALLSLAGCGGGPAVPKADLMDDLNKSMPAGLTVTDVSYEVVPAANGQSAATIPVKAKITATASQDLYSAPTDPADIKPVNDFINFYNDYVMWTNALQRTSYADELNQTKPKIDTNVPKFLHRDQAKGDTFTGYCDVTAEHQVDRWIFSPIQGIDWGDKKPGSAASQFGPSCVGANAPDGQAAAQQFTTNENAMTQFKKQFADKHAAESQAIVQVLKPQLTGGQEFQTVAVSPGLEVPNYRFTFSEYDPQTNHFKIRFRSTMGDFMGSGEFVGGYILIFQDAANYMPAALIFVGSYDAKTGNVTLLRKGFDPEVLHTRH